MGASNKDEKLGPQVDNFCDPSVSAIQLSAVLFSLCEKSCGDWADFFALVIRFGACGSNGVDEKACTEMV